MTTSNFNLSPSTLDTTVSILRDTLSRPSHETAFYNKHGVHSLQARVIAERVAEIKDRADIYAGRSHDDNGELLAN